MFKIETKLFVDCCEEDNQATLTSAVVSVTVNSMRAGQGLGVGHCWIHSR